MKRMRDMMRRVEPVAADELSETELAAVRELVTTLGRVAGKALIVGPHADRRAAAQAAVAAQLGHRLYRVDLHGVMDKYVGETEKNLGRVLGVAERIGATLLFDEADPLFAKRSQVVDRLDRHAAVDTGYLLRCLEQHPGGIIISAGDEKGLDDSLTRLIGSTVRLAAGDGTALPELIPVTWTASAEAVAKYAELTDDFNPIHLDPVFAAATPFGRPIVQGTLTLNLVWQSLRETFGPAALPGVEIDIRFTAPVLVGETVTATGRPKKDNAAVYEIAVTKDDGTVVLSGTAITSHVAQGVL